MKRGSTLLALLVCLLPAAPGAWARAAKGETTIEGCIVQQDADIYLEPKNQSKWIRLVPAGNQDLAAHVGQRVRLRGIEQRAGVSANGTYAKNQNASQALGAGNLPQNDEPAAIPPAAPPQIANRELLVTAIKTLSKSCPRKTPRARGKSADE